MLYYVLARLWDCLQWCEDVSGQDVCVVCVELSKKTSRRSCFERWFVGSDTQGPAHSNSSVHSFSYTPSTFPPTHHLTMYLDSKE